MQTHSRRDGICRTWKRAGRLILTFVTRLRRPLGPQERQIALDCCTHDHKITYWLHVAVVMPEHVHFVFTPFEDWSLSKILKRIKGNSSRLINLAIGRKGPLWQDESFDRIVRNSEDLRKKCEYIAQNPVRAGLVDCVDDYPWIWREWIEGKSDETK